MEKCWAIIPAAGSGRRFQEKRPKQYWKIAGKTVLEHTVESLLCHSKITHIIIPLGPKDDFFSSLALASHPRVTAIEGGATRMHSVERGLHWIQTRASSHDGVLIHDAARPALHQHDLCHLITAVEGDPVGGILGVPIHDTIKFVPEGEQIGYTLPREGLWRALTPQLFRLTLLLKGIERMKALGRVATDDAHLVEVLGYRPRMIKAQYPNPKLTYPEDFEYLSHLLLNREGVML